MIKTELDNDDQDKELSRASNAGDRFFIITAIIVAFAAGVIAVVLIRYNRVQPLPDNPARYKNVQALPLGSQNNTSVGQITPGSNISNQANSPSSSLGSSYAGLQNTPQGKGTPKSSNLQSSSSSTSTGQTINTNLPY